MVNVNPKDANQEQQKFIRKITKLKHPFNFAKVDQSLKIEGTQDMIVNDCHSRLDH